MSERDSTRTVAAVRKIDDLGRVVIPRFLRDQYGIQAWTEVEQCPTPEGILLRPHLAAVDCARAARSIRAAVDADASSYDDAQLASIRRLADELAATLDAASERPCGQGQTENEGE